MKNIKTLLLVAAFAAPIAVWAADITQATTQEAFARLGLARQAVAQDPPRNALFNSPLAAHPMFKEVFASLNEAQLNEAAAQLMAEQFTSQELKALVDFRNSPEGKSIGEKMPGYQQMLGATMQGYLSVAFQKMTVKQGGQGASSIPLNTDSPAGAGATGLPPMQIPAQTPVTAAPTVAPAAMPSGGGTPLKH